MDESNPNWHEATADAVDDQWLSAIGTAWKRLTGECWETRDGETREEGVSANIGALFQKIEDLQGQLEKYRELPYSGAELLPDCARAFVEVPKRRFPVCGKLFNAVEP